MNEQHFYKEIEAHFCLRTNKTKKPEMIYLIVRIDGKQYKLSCGVKVYPNQWHKGIAEESNLLSKRDNANNKIANKKLTEILERFSKFRHSLCSCDNVITDMGKLLKSFIYSTNMKTKKLDVVTLIKNAFKTYYEVNKPNTKKITVDRYKGILDYYIKYLKGLNEEQQNKAFTKEGFIMWREHLATRMKDPNIKFGAYQANLYGGLIARLINEVLYYNPKLKIEIVKWSMYEDGRNKQEIGHFELSSEELDKIKNLVFDNKKKNGDIAKVEVKNNEYRNLFILQTLCGLRVSDLHSLIKGDYEVKKEEQQQYYIIKTKKNAISAYVMQTPELDKYLEMVRNSSVKEFNDLCYNRKLKEICKIAGLNRTIERKDTQGRILRNPLYEVVTSHCARYTFIRLMYLAGYPEMDVAKMVGHKDDTMIKEVYNKKTDDDFMRNINKAKAKVEGKIVEPKIEDKPQKKSSLIDAFFAYNDIVSLIDMKESGINIYDDSRLRKVISVIKQSVNKATLDKAINIVNNADENSIAEFKKKVTSINDFIWDVGKHFADIKLYMMYQYKLNKLGLLDSKPVDEETLDYIWQSEIHDEEEAYYNNNSSQL